MKKVFNMRKMLIVIQALILVLIIAACGSADDESVTEDVNEEASTDEGSKELTRLESIKERGVIDIGIEGAYPPFNYFNDNNELEGFDVDIANEIASRMGVEVNFVPTPWDTIIGGLISERYDIILSSMAATEERRQKVDFTDIYYSAGPMFFTLKESDMEVNEDIKGKKVGLSTGSSFQPHIEEYGGEVVTYKSDTLAFEDLANKRIDAVLVNQAAGGYLIAQGEPFKAIGEPMESPGAAITVNKGEEDLVEELNKHLNDMLNDGTYEEISMKWFAMDIRKKD